MTTYEGIVAELCKEVYRADYSQIVIDLVQDEIEELLNRDDSEGAVTAEQIGSVIYSVTLILDIIDTARFERDACLLDRLEKALRNWEDDVEATERVLRAGGGGAEEE